MVTASGLKKCNDNFIINDDAWGIDHNRLLLLGSEIACSFVKGLRK